MSSDFVEVIVDGDIEFVEGTIIGTPGAHGSRGLTGSGPDRALTVNLADFLMEMVHPDGYMTEYTDLQNVRPYKSNLAAMALADASKVTGDSTYLAAAWQWLDWYADHMEPVTGYVFDYNLIAGSLVSTGDMDSTDSYAATFLLAVKACWLASYDRVKLATYTDGIELALTAILGTLEDGLTWCKPHYKVVFLMDEAETLAGLKAGVYLSKILEDTDLELGFATAYNTITAGVESRMWDPDTQSYIWAIHEDGTEVATDWDNVLHALQNVWAVAWGVATGSRAVDLMATFDDHHPEWDKSTSIFYGCPIWAFQRINDSDRADEVLLNVLRASWSIDRAWPFDALAASTILLAVTVGGMDHYGVAPPRGSVISGGGGSGQDGDPGPQGPAGPQGDPGEDGTIGVDGEPGPIGLTGPAGPIGPQGPQGEPGVDGEGIGMPGDSAYEVAVANGFVGTEPQWLASLIGADGEPGNDGADSTVPGPQGPQGDPGEDSTVPGPTGPAGAASTVPGPAGPQGDPGIDGNDGADSVVPGPQGIPGEDGLAGNDGLDSTVPGPAGPQGPTGAASTVPGPTGPTGAASTVPGPTGPTGPTGAASTVPGPGHLIGGVKGVLVTATGTARLYNDSGRTLTITACRASAGTVPTGAAIIVDINKNGTTIFSTQGNRPTIAISGATSGKVTNMNTTSLADGDYLTIDVDQVGSTIAGADLTVQVEVS